MRRLAIIVASFLVAGCGIFPQKEKVLEAPLLTPPEVAYDTVKVTRGTIEDRVTVEATFVPSELRSLSFRWRSGRLRSLPVKLGDEVKAGDLVAELDTGSLENRISRLKLLVRKAELAAEKAALLSRDRFEREDASINVDLAKLDLADAQAELEQSRIYAPSAGAVVYIGPEHEGDPIEAFRTIVQIADLRRMQLVYSGEKASSFHVGMSVSVRVGNRTLAGEVAMAPGSTPTEARDDMRNSVIVRLPQLPADVRRGDSATISLLLARHDNVIVLSRDLVHQYLGRSFVQVLKDGVKSERTIELGLQTTTEVEVTSGLSVGEQVVSR